MGVGKRDRHYDRVDIHLRGHSSAARRGLRADAFVVLAYTRNRRLAKMWEAWLHMVFNPPYAERRPERPPLFPRARRRDKPVEAPAASAKYAELIGAPLADAFKPIGGCLENGSTPEAHVDKPPPGWVGATAEGRQFHVWRSSG
jgi:hypothetical protein